MPTIVVYYIWMNHHLFGFSSAAGDRAPVLLIMVYNYAFVMLSILFSGETGAGRLELMCIV